MLHPVGPLAAAVYWRRRALVLSLLLAVLVGGGWLGVALLTRGSEDPGAGAAGTSSAASTQAAGTPALEQVVPSLASVQTPTPVPSPSTAGPSTAAPTTEAPAPGPQPGGTCTDDMIGVGVRGPGTVASGSGPTLELVVTNVSPVPCVRVLDLELQEIVLLDQGGARLWGGNDCQPESSDDVRTLAPGEQVAFPLVWSGLTSEPSCTAARTPVPPGQYVLRGRLDTAPSPDTPLTLT